MITTDFEERIDAYEAALFAGDASLRDVSTFLPSSVDDTYYELLVELLRITLEHQWQPGDTAAIEQFRVLYPQLFELHHWLNQLAFEEYRLRSSEGQQVDKQEYAHRYGLDVSRWQDLNHVELEENESEQNGVAESWQEYSRSEPDAAQVIATRRQLPQVGERFGPFELTALLGEGAFGKVFLAKQKGLADRFVALKITLGRPLEAQKLARLQHGNIVPVYSVHRRGKLAGVCMPYLGSATLADLLAGLRLHTRLPKSAESLVATLELRQSQLSTLVNGEAPRGEPREARSGFASEESLRRLAACPLETYFTRILMQVTAGLAQAHERGIIHRDLKPANILISDDGEPLLLDFNLAAEQSGHVARLGGTLPYMAPEQLTHFQGSSSGEVDARSDIYSLGVVLYECLASRHPFPVRRGMLEETLLQMIADRKSAPIDVRQINPAVSPGLAAIVHKCLEVDPANRYQRATDLHEDLQRHLESRPLKYAKDVSVTERVQKWCNRHPRLSSMTTVLSIALAFALVAGSIWHSREQSHAKLAAEDTFTMFEDQALEARSFLVIGAPGSAWEARGIEASKKALNQYGVLNSTRWQDRADIARLSSEHRQALGTNLTEIMLLLAQRSSATSENGKMSDLPTRQALETSALETWKQLVGTPSPRLLSELKAGSQTVTLSLEQPQDIAELVQIAAALQQGESLGNAERLLRQLTELRPRDAFAWLALGEYYLVNNRFSEAEAAGTAALALRSELDLAWQFRGIVYLQQKRWSDAEADLSAALSLRPQSPAAWFNLGVVRQAQEKHQAAIEDFSKAIEQGLPETRVYFSRSRSHAALGDKKASEADRQEGITRQPHDVLSLVERALAVLPENPEGAKQDLVKSVELAPSSRFTLMNLAHVQTEHLAQTSDAIATLGTLLTHFPNDPDTLGSRAVLFARLGKQAEALQDLKQLLHTDNRSPLAIYQSACVYALLGKESPEKRNQAMQLLATSFAMQPSLVNTARTDVDLTLLHSEQVWNQLVPPMTTSSNR